MRKIPVIMGKGFPDRHIQIPEVASLWAEFKYKELAPSTIDRIIKGGYNGEIVIPRTELQEKFISTEIWSKGNAGVIMGVKSDSDDRLFIYVCRGAPKTVSYADLAKSTMVNWKDPHWPCRKLLNIILGVEHVEA